MSSKMKNSLRSKSAVLLYLIVLGLLLNFIIPPMQNPDEPQHFGMILIFAFGENEQAVIEHEIIKIMGNNRWWKFLGLGKPAPLPKSLTQVDFFQFSGFVTRLEHITFFHAVLGTLTKPIAKRTQIIHLYYFYRFLLFSFLVAAMFLIYLTIQRMTQHLSQIFFFGFLFILFLPQFWILSISVNTDACVILLGSLFFYAFISLITESFKLIFIILLFFAAGIGLFADKSSMFMVLLIPLLFFLGKDRKKITRAIFLISCGIFLIMIWATWLFPVYIHNVLLILKRILKLDLANVVMLSSKSDFNITFIQLLIDSFFLKFGWMAYYAAPIFRYIWRALMVLSAVGLLFYAGRSIWNKAKKKPLELESALQIKIVIISLSAIVVQVLALWIFYGSRQVFPQGRYLYPMIIPFAFLFILGMKSLGEIISQKAAQLGIALIILLEFLFFNYVVWNYLIPVFHLSLQTPHPGI